MKWCRQCVLPDTRPNLSLNADGVCNACANHDQKEVIDWAARARDFQQLVDHVKSRSAPYDCLIPVSGGKDSTWQVLKCLSYGLRPLAVTWRPPGRTLIGQENLDNLIQLGVDHIDFSVNPSVEAAFMVKTFEKAGSIAIPMHLGLYNIPLMIACRFSIPLVVWGENSALEYGSQDERHQGYVLNREWLKHYGVTDGTTAQDWVDDELSKADLTPYFGPDDQALANAGVKAVFLGHYFEWDPQVTYAEAKAHGFKENKAGARVGLYDFADIDDDYIGLHHWLKWYKFGFTRLFDNLSLEIRNGRITRNEAVEIIRQRGDETPKTEIAQFCDYVGRSPDWFYQAAEPFRNLSIWEKKQGQWQLPGFLIDDWRWE